MNETNLFKQVKEYFISLQKTIKEKVTSTSESDFQRNQWDYSGENAKSGGGVSFTLENNFVFEKAGLNLSIIQGKFNASLRKLLKKESKLFNATGVSLVFHPTSPLIPTIHMNVRFFESDSGESWFGGGIDLTPYYPFLEDFTFFHKTIKTNLDKLAPAYYEKHKEICDDYFTIKHRGEMRGIGGVFFDYLTGDKKEHFQLIKTLGASFIPCYFPIVQKRLKQPYEKIHRDFQLYRRGRYVEFNLVYDRGTQFGFKSGGNIDAILMSLPPMVAYPAVAQFEKHAFAREMTALYQKKKWA